MEKLEINKTAKELAEEAIKNDIEHINNVLDNLDLSGITKGYTYVVVDTYEALKMLRDNGFKVDKSPYSKGNNCYMVSWLSSEEEQA